MYISLKKNYEFNNVFKKGKTVVGRELSLHYLNNKLNYNRLGFTTVRNFGHVVAKNRKRRLLREAYRQLDPQVKQGYDLVLMGRITNYESNFHTVYADLKKLLKKAQLLEDR